MSQPRSESVHLGFLTVIEPAAGGFVGGLLVTNLMGRPLEFQCTTPVRPNRTQEILYGSSLRPFLYSELIGKTLYERLQVKPHVVLVQLRELLHLRDHINVPVGWLPEGNSVSDLPDEQRVQLGRQGVWTHPDHPGDVDVIQQFSKRISSDADLNEPIDRIRDALEETLKGAA